MLGDHDGNTPKPRKHACSNVTEVERIMKMHDIRATNFPPKAQQRRRRPDWPRKTQTSFETIPRSHRHGGRACRQCRRREIAIARRPHDFHVRNDCKSSNEGSCNSLHSTAVSVKKMGHYKNTHGSVPRYAKPPLGETKQAGRNQEQGQRYSNASVTLPPRKGKISELNPKTRPQLGSTFRH